ncbi:trimeric intracellular cation channel family protein [Arabiibacter massiliensis]|uniref:trimeric intracellular cation channel family protein n=1 Tax=Arabiibacter massiliensis TaxID=1870985 RepID=UPI0009B97107|nr:TRIC cation channel family protein [Arabiibacter massiliensis]
MLEVVLAIPFWLELAATLTGGLSGAMSAVRARYDIFGVVCIAIITGLAGGIMRDLLLQNYGIYAFQRPTLIVACAVAGVVVFYFGKLATYLDPVVDLLDNLSVALWAVISVGKGLSAGLDVVPAVILGTITAVGGGILRDICMNREPDAFQAGALYGSAALVGSAAYALMAQNHILDSYAPITCAVLVLGLRYASLFFGWSTKPPKDYSDVVANAVARPVKSVAKRVRPPKGKVEREKERNRAYAKLSYFWKRMNGEIPPPRKRRELEQAAEAAPSPAVEAGAEAEANDPSDRIVVNRDELHRLLDASAAFQEDPPRDPFEPRA